MTKTEHIELLKSMGFYEEVPDKWIKNLPNVGKKEDFTDCAVVYYPTNDKLYCYIGGNQILSGTHNFSDLDVFEENIMNGYCTEEEKKVSWPLFESMCMGRQAIIQSLGTIPTQVNAMKEQGYSDEELEAIRSRAYLMCLEMLKIYGVEESALKPYWGLDC